MKKITKTILLLLLLILFVPYKYVGAMNPPSIPNVSTGEGAEDEKIKYPEDGVIEGDKTHIYVFPYSAFSGADSKIDINAYDLEGHSVIPYTKTTETKFKAGTFIGINLREFISVYWSISLLTPYEKIRKITTEKYPNTENSAYQSDASMCDFYLSNIYGADDFDPFDPEKQKFYIPYWDACTRRGQCKGDPTEEIFYWGETEDKKWSERITELEKQQNSSNDYCILKYTLDTSASQYGTVPDKIKTKNQSKIVKDVLGSIGGGSGPTIQYAIKDPNNYNENDITISTKNGEGMVKGKLKEYKQDEPIYEDCTKGVTISLDVSPDIGHTKTKIPTGGIGSLAGHVTEQNYESNCFLGGTYYATYEYSPGKTCINVKTSKVRYIDSAKKCDNNTEKELDMGKTKDPYLNPNSDEEVEYWQYFIPFNTPTSDSEKDVKNDFFIRVESITPASSEIGTPEECIKYMEDHPVVPNSKILNYKDSIVAISPAKGTINEKINLSGNYSEDIQYFKKGYYCQISAKIKFNIAQHFYGENEKNSEITGYSFYYRPIDKDQPFPNKIAANSIWVDLYDEDTNEIKVKVKNSDKVITTKLSDSFKEVTYSTEGISRKDILDKIDENENYTSWEKINAKNGTSEFIDKLINLRRKGANTKNLYKLGCGPDNLDWSGCK